VRAWILGDAQPVPLDSDWLINSIPGLRPEGIAGDDLTALSISE